MHTYNIINKIFIICLSFTKLFIFSYAYSEEIKISKEFDIKPEQIGWALFDINKNKIISKNEIKTGFIPGSISKLATALFTLEHLGSDYKFKTRLFTCNTSENTTLFLEGGGDPYLTTSHIFDMILELAKYYKNYKIKQFIYNDSSLKSQVRISHTSEPNETDNPAVSALSVEFNRFVLWNSKNIIPKTDQIIFKPGRNFSAVEKYRFYQQNDKSIWELNPNIKLKLKHEFPIRQPAKFTAKLFSLLANYYGIKLPKATNGFKPKICKLIHERYSLPVSRLIELNLEYSNNLMAELLLLQSIKKSKNLKVNIKSAGEILTSWIRKKINATDNNILINGSGLTSLSRTTPSFWIKLLNYAKDKKFGDRFFWTLLSISGKKGYLDRRLNDPDNAFRVWAKTGSMDYSNTITGYLMTKNGNNLIFSILITDFKKRKISETENNIKALKLKNGADLWANKMQDAQDKIIKYWIQTY